MQNKYPILKLRCDNEMRGCKAAEKLLGTRRASLFSDVFLDEFRNAPVNHAQWGEPMITLAMLTLAGSGCDARSRAAPAH